MKRAAQFPEHFEALVRHSADAIFIVEPQGLRVVLANHLAAERVSMPTEKLLGRSLLPHLSPEALDVAGAALVRGRLAPPDPPTDADFILQNGVRIPARFAANLDDATGSCYLVIAVRDREDALAREKRSRKTEHLHHLLMQDPRSFTWSMNAAMEITHVSASTRDVLGFSDIDVIGMSALQLLTPRSLDRLTALLNAHVLGEESAGDRVPRMIELEFLRDDGGTISTDTIVSVSRLDTGELGGVVALSRDASERRALTEQREARLIGAHDRDKAEALRRLAGACGQNFESTLRTVHQFATTLERGLDPASESQHQVDRIVRTVRGATSLTRDLRRYGGLDNPTVMPVSMNRLLTGLGTLIREVVPKSTIVKFELGEDLPSFAADPAQMQEALLHLARNASEAIGQREGTITIRSSHVRISAEDLAGFVVGSPLRTGEFVFVDVVDDGAGIDASRMADLFEPFYSTKPQKDGLGLATVLGFARGHEATIQVLSAPGRGSRFRILFPVLRVKKSLVPMDENASAALEDAPQRQAIVVSKDDDLLKVSNNFFARRECSLLTTKSVAEAMEVLELTDYEIDYLVIDDANFSPEDHDGIRDLDRAGRLPNLIVCYERMPDAVLMADESEHHPAYVAKPICATGLEDALNDLGARAPRWRSLPAGYSSTSTPTSVSEASSSRLNS